MSRRSERLQQQRQQHHLHQQQQQQQEQDPDRSVTPPPMVLDNRFMCNMSENIHTENIDRYVRRVTITRDFTVHAQLGKLTSKRIVTLMIDQRNGTIDIRQECLSTWEGDEFFHPHQTFLGPFEPMTVDFS